MISEVIDVQLVASSIRLTTPILLAAMAALLTHRCGLVNVAIEGTMLFGSFVAVVVSYWTGNPWIASLLAAAGGALLSVILAGFVIMARSNPLITGLGLNMFSAGVTTFAVRALFGIKGGFISDRIVGLPLWDFPLLARLPVIGPVFQRHSPIVYASWLLAIGMHVFLYHTTLGLRIRGSGEKPTAAKTLGINVPKLQFWCVVCSGAFAGLAGAQLSLGHMRMFVENMTAGRGFIGLAASVFGQAVPLRVAGASILFGVCEALVIRLQGLRIPNHFIQMIPYVVTMAVLFVVSWKELRPKVVESLADGKSKTTKRPVAT